MNTPDKTLEEIEADEFLKKCVEITHADGEMRIVINCVAELRIPDEIVKAEEMSRNGIAATVSQMVADRMNFDLETDVWPTLRTRLRQVLKEIK